MRPQVSVVSSGSPHSRTGNRPGTPRERETTKCRRDTYPAPLSISSIDRPQVLSGNTPTCPSPGPQRVGPTGLRVSRHGTWTEVVVGTPQTLLPSVGPRGEVSYPGYLSESEVLSVQGRSFSAPLWGNPVGWKSVTVAGRTTTPSLFHSRTPYWQVSTLPSTHVVPRGTL